MTYKYFIFIFQDLLNFDDPLNVEASQQFEESKVGQISNEMMNYCITYYMFNLTDMCTIAVTVQIVIKFVLAIIQGTAIYGSNHLI